jgi:hypothetical protein
MPESTPTRETDESELLLREARRVHTEDMAALEGTEGWAALTAAQKAFMVHALFFREPQAEVHAEAGDWYCHAAVWAVEHEHSPETVRPDLDHIEESFYDGEYAQPQSVAQVREQILTAGFPAVVHIAKAPPPLTLLQQHTFLALGQDTDGDIVVWEKEAEELPYRRTTLSENYAKYMDGKTPLFWGVRRMRSAQR